MSPSLKLYFSLKFYAVVPNVAPQRAQNLLPIGNATSQLEQTSGDDRLAKTGLSVGPLITVRQDTSSVGINIKAVKTLAQSRIGL
jgi:hypothetical protein